MSDLTTLYRSAVRQRIAELDAARERSDRDAIRRIAHSLRGSGGTYGFPQVTAASAAVEDSSDDDFDTRLDDLLALLQRIAAGGS